MYFFELISSNWPLRPLFLSNFSSGSRSPSRRSASLYSIRLFRPSSAYCLLLFCFIGLVGRSTGYDIPGDAETDVDLLTPLENLINTDPRVYRTRGLDGLPAVGITRGVEIVVPYRIYLPRKFFRNFAIVASVKPKDHQGGYLFAIVNAFDTVVDLGVLLEPSGSSQTNISLIYTDSQAESSSQVLASFLVPAFTNQWTQLALEVNEDTVALYFRCMRFATRQVNRKPMQLQMDDASKLYIANAGPLIGGGFEENLSTYANRLQKNKIDHLVPFTIMNKLLFCLYSSFINYE